MFCKTLDQSQLPMTRDAKPTAIDLFCGCGGMGLGLEMAGFEVLYANDINMDAANTYRKNLHAGIVECGDISGIDPYDVKKRVGRKRGHHSRRDPRARGFRRLAGGTLTTRGTCDVPASREVRRDIQTKDVPDGKRLRPAEHGRRARFFDDT